MKQLKLFDKPSKEELLALHMRSFRINFTYDELRAWHKKAEKLSIEVREDAIQNAYDNIELPEIDD
tara:strand:- start:212 stop:409 length:198 start_codon:yes stop_codon:yes gene_type:complete